MWLTTLASLAGGLTHAGDAITIDLKQRGEGETVLVERTMTTVNGVKQFDSDGKATADESKKTVLTLVYRETYLAREGKKAPTRIRQEYEKATLSGGDQPLDLPFHGKTVLIEKKDGDYHYTFDGGKELTDEEAECIDFTPQEAGKAQGERRLPASAVAVKDSWQIDMKPYVARAEGGPFVLDEPKASGTGVLQKTYSKEGRQFGVIHTHQVMPLKAVKGRFSQTPLQDGSKVEVEEDMDLCIDGQMDAGTTKYKETMTWLIDSGKEHGSTMIERTVVTTRRELPKK
jgi:hypothetical protein